MSGDKWSLSLGDAHLHYSCPTVILLLFTVTHSVQSVVVCVSNMDTPNLGRYVLGGGSTAE